MRINIDIDEDVLDTGAAIAAFRGMTLGQVISDLAREGLHLRGYRMVRNGVPLMPSRRLLRHAPTLRDVNALRDN